ncbi:MAG: L-histidine N(alpha)-methyltransferase [Myxococcota bacterium]|nr:L-histidine N(alpha)-methyltransferase [Myxococcota bacterium]
MGLARLELIESGGGPSHRDTMARDVRAGLAHPPRSIPPKYFYDAEGSRLFDAICDLPEYYLTRSERSLLAAHADSIVERCGATALVEIGSGMARKTGFLVTALCSRCPAPRYVPFDISRAAIEASAYALLSANPSVRVRGVVGDFSRDLARLALAAPASAGPRLFAFLGSTIGNMDEAAAPQFIQQLAEVMNDRDRLVLGLDLAKAPEIILAAYNDARGVTAAFNKNVLRAISRDLDADFDERVFEHLAIYEPSLARIEMYLVATRRHTVTVRAIDLRVELAEGERVMTEISRKFTRATAEHTLAGGGMHAERWIPAADGSFALCIARRA